MATHILKRLMIVKDLLRRLESSSENIHWLYWTLRSLQSPRRSILVYRKWREDKRVLPLRSRLWWDYLGSHLHMHSHLGRFPNLVNPSGLNDKVQWLKLLGRDPIQITFADKFLVRKWVDSVVGEEYLVPLRAHSPNAYKIPLDALQKPCVVKASHDSGSAVVLTNPDTASAAEALAQVEILLGRKFGVRTAEWAYRRLKPRILVEELLVDNNHASLTDYKFYCSYGKILWVQVIWDRQNGPKEAILAPDGSPTGFRSLYPSWHSASIERLPNTWEEMSRVAESLSQGRPFVRVDLYSASGRVLFGEMTNWPYAGCWKNNADSELGEQIQLPSVT